MNARPILWSNIEDSSASQQQNKKLKKGIIFHGMSRVATALQSTRRAEDETLHYFQEQGKC